MEDEYVIINKTDIQKRINELKKDYNQESEEHMKDWFLGQIIAFEQILAQSTPLIPEIEKAYNWGYTHCEDGCEQDVNDCTSNLKLDI